MIWIKDLIGPHDGHQILCLTQIDDIMGPSRDHMNCLDLLSADFKFNDVICPNLSFLDQSMSCNDDKELPFTVMLVLSFRYPGFGDIHRDPSTISRLQ